MSESIENYQQTESTEVVDDTRADLATLEAQVVDLQTQKNKELEAIVDEVYGELWMLKGMALSVLINKSTFKELFVAHPDIADVNQLTDLLFEQDTKVLWSEWLWSAFNKIGRFAFEITAFSRTVFALLQQKQQEKADVIADIDEQITTLKQQIQETQTNWESPDEGSAQESWSWEDLPSNETNNASQDPEAWIEEEEDVPEEPKPSTAGAFVVGAGAIATGHEVARRMTLPKQRETLQSLIDQLELHKKRSGHSEEAVKAIDRNIAAIKQAQNDLTLLRGGNRDVLEMRKKVGNILPPEQLETLAKWFGDKAIQKFVKISDDAASFAELQQAVKAKNASDVQRLLWMSKEIDNDMRKFLDGAVKSKQVLTQASTVLSESAKLTRFARFAKQMPYVDMMFAGVDIFVRHQERAYADQVKERNQQRGNLLSQQADAHLINGLGWAAIGAYFEFACASAGPPWWLVGLAVGWVAASVEYAMDSCYYDVHNFYQQNFEDFQQQIKTEVRQAILQITVAQDQTLPPSLNENIARYITHISDSQEETVLEAAYRALLTEEIGTDDAESIDQWMEYIKTHCQDAAVVDFCNKGNPQGVSMLIKQAQQYVQMHQDEAYQEEASDNQMTLENYHKWHIDKCQQDEQLCQKFFGTQTNPDQLQVNPTDAMDLTQLTYLYHQMEQFALSLDDYQDSPLYSQMKRRIEYIRHAYQVRTRDKTPEQIPTVGAVVCYTKTIKAWLQSATLEGVPETVRYPSEGSPHEPWLPTQYANGTVDQHDTIDVSYISDDMSQNLCYDVARALHGYGGKNTSGELLSFFGTPDKEDNLGVYYGSGWRASDGWKIQSDWALDKTFSWQEITDQLDEWVSVDDIMEDMMSPSAFTFFSDAVLQSGLMAFTGPLSFSAYQEIVKDRTGLDSETETADGVMNEWFRYNFREVLQQHKTYLDDTKQAEVQDNIRSYITQHATEWYIRLPYHLVAQFKHYGLGSPEHYLFYYDTESGTITGVSNESYLGETLPYIDTKQRYSGYVEWLDEAEKDSRDKEMGYYMDMVEQQIQPLQRLLSQRARNNEDELDMPEEYEQLIADKIQERTQCKEVVKGYDMPYARAVIVNGNQQFDSCKEYATRFEAMYVQLLEGIETNMRSNDQDDAHTIQTMVDRAATPLVSFDETDKTFVVQENQSMMHAMAVSTFGTSEITQEKEFFDQYVSQALEIEGKNDVVIQQQCVSEDTRIEWEWYANQLWRAIVSFQADFDSHIRYAVDTTNPYTPDIDDYYSEDVGNFCVEQIDILQQEVKGDVLLETTRKKILDLYIKDYMSRISPSRLSDAPTWENPATVETEIVDVDQTTQAGAEAANDMQIDLEQTAPEYVRWAERGTPKMYFDPPRVESRWLTTEFVKESDNVFEIAGIRFDFGDQDEVTQEDMTEIGYIGNFINFCRSEFMWKWASDDITPFEVTNVRGNIEFNFAGKALDTRVLDIHEHPDKYPTLYADRDKRQRLVDYLNNLDGWQANE